MEGEALPLLDDLDHHAAFLAELLGGRRRAFDWQSLPFFVGWLGIADIDGLIVRLICILTHRPRVENHGNSKALD